MPRNWNKKIIISYDDDSQSLFAASDDDYELQGDEDNPLRRVMLVVNETEPQTETGVSISYDDSLYKLKG